MSFLDKTGNTSAANATASPLYAEIDTLNREIRQYKGLLQSANEEVDDKLRKLDSAGTNVVSISKELDNARRRIRDLEAGAPAGRTTGEGEIIKELRAVRDELTNERSSLLRRLKDIQDVRKNSSHVARS
jgi:chromosome segregation ATPase